MHRDWTTNNEKNKQEMKELLYSNKILLDKLKEICYSKIKNEEKKRRSYSSYETPNWDLRQADSNGYLRALYELESLFNLEDKE